MPVQNDNIGSQAHFLPKTHGIWTTYGAALSEKKNLKAVWATLTHLMHPAKEETDIQAGEKGRGDTMSQ